jgi:hypothetical protein
VTIVNGYADHEVSDLRPNITRRAAAEALARIEEVASDV